MYLCALSDYIKMILMHSLSVWMPWVQYCFCSAVPAWLIWLLPVNGYSYWTLLKLHQAWFQLRLSMWGLQIYKGTFGGFMRLPERSFFCIRYLKLNNWSIATSNAYTQRQIFFLWPHWPFLWHLHQVRNMHLTSSSVFDKGLISVPLNRTNISLTCVIGAKERCEERCFQWNETSFSLKHYLKRCHMCFMAQLNQLVCFKE